MSSLIKNFNSFLQVTLFGGLFLFASLVVAKETVDGAKFNETLEYVESLLKTDVVLAHKTLIIYEKSLDNLSIEQQVNYYKLLAEVFIGQSQFVSAKKTIDTTLSLAKKLSSPSSSISELFYMRGFSLENLGDSDGAVASYKQGLEVAESLHDNVNIAHGLINLGAMAYLTDDYERALVLLNDAYKIAELTNDDEVIGSANSELGIVYSNLGQDEQSMEYYQQSYEHFKKAGMLLGAHNSLNNIASNHMFKNNFTEAIAVYQRIISESTYDSPSYIMYGVYAGMAWAYLKKEDSNPEAAYQYLLKSKEYLKGTQRYDIELQYFVDQAFILYQLERYQETLASIEEAEKLLSDHQSLTVSKKQAHLNMINLKGKIFFKQGNFEKAYQTESLLLALVEQLYENEDSRSVAQVRLKLEAEQEDLKEEILQKEQAIYEANLLEAKLESKEQRMYVILSALVALAFAWMLIKLLHSQRQLKVASTIDALTGIANRRSLLNKANTAFKLARHKQHQLSILIIDIDDFKGINDRLGHHQGDEVLKNVVQICSDMMRKSDIFGRLGGEEFLVCLPGQSLQSATDIAERIRLSIAQHCFSEGVEEKVTVSIGVASLASDPDLTSLIKRADKLLYQAKRLGRNKVCN